MACSLAAHAACGGVAFSDPDVLRGRLPLDVCLSTDASSATGAITYNTAGQVYNASTSVTRQTICSLPSVGEQGPLEKIAVIVQTSNVDTFASTTCHLRAYDAAGDIVFSTPNVAGGPCSAGYFLQNLNGLSLHANVRCSLSPKNAAGHAAIVHLHEAIWKW